MNIPLVWEYDEKNNKAVCLFFTTAKEQKYNKETIIKGLYEKKYPGISLSENSAIIEDYSSFVAQHSGEQYKSRSLTSIPGLNLQSIIEKRDSSTNPLVALSSKSRSARSNKEKSSEPDETVHEVVNPLIALSHKIPPAKSSKGRSDSPISSSLTAESSVHDKRKQLKRSVSNSALTPKSLVSSKSPLSPREKTTYSPRYDFKPRKASYESILICYLITERDHTDIFRDTLSCKDEFIKKTAEDRIKRTATYLRNVNSFKKETQYIQNDNLYPIKKKIIILLEKLFEQELDPVYQEWKKEPDTQRSPAALKELFTYLRHAVWSTLRNEHFGNNKPTEYELMNDSMRYSRFKGNEAKYHQANNGIRTARTTQMMNDLSFLVNACSIELTSAEDRSEDGHKLMSEEATNMLLSFQEHLLRDADRVKRIQAVYSELQQLLIESGKMEWVNLQLTQVLDSRLVDKDQSIGEYSSLIGTVRAFLIEANKTIKKPVESGTCHQLADQVVTEVVRLLVKDTEFGKTPYIEKLEKLDRNLCPTADEDIYLNQDWIAACKGYLEHMEWEKLLKNIKSASGVEKVAEKLFQVIRAKGKMLIQQPLLVAESPLTASSDEVEAHSTGAMTSLNF
ncbi:hypothetical protein [Legionella fallonii]|nr:hypothetical protein [Legionella fallonii]